VHNLKNVVKVHGAKRESEHQSEHRDAERLDPDGSADLTVQPAHRLKHAELAPTIGDRNRERIHDAENGHQHRHGNLHRRQREPLIGDSENVVFELAVGEHEHLPHSRISAEDLSFYFRRLSDR